MFLDNKYTKIYNQIIARSHVRVNITEYTERHHVIPRSLGGSNADSNLAILTAREHYLCHWLLTKMTTNRLHYNKMIRALWCLSWGRKWQKRHIIPSRQYERLRNKFSEIISEDRLGKSWDDRFGIEKSAILKQKLSDNMIGKKNPMFGKKHPLEIRDKISKAVKGKVGGLHSEYHRQQIIKSNKTRGVSDTTKQKLRDLWTDEKRKAFSKMHTGKVYSNETKKKMSKSAKLRSDKTQFNWHHPIYGEFIGSRRELSEKFPDQNLKMGELLKTTRGEYKYRGWDIIS